MPIDLTVAAIAAVAQFVMGFLSWRVTLNPLPDQDQQKKRKLMLDRLFIICGILTFVCVVMATVRGNKLEVEIDGLRDEQHRNSNVISDLRKVISDLREEQRQNLDLIKKALKIGELTPVAETVPVEVGGRPDLRTGLFYQGVRFDEASKSIVADMKLSNKGDQPALNVGLLTVSALTSTMPTLEDSANKAYAQLEGLAEKSGGISRAAIAPGAVELFKASSPSLSVEDLRALREGDLRVLFVGRATYLSPSGTHYFALYCASATRDLSTVEPCAPLIQAK